MYEALQAVRKFANNVTAALRSKRNKETKDILNGDSQSSETSFFRYLNNTYKKVSSVVLDPETGYHCFNVKDQNNIMIKAWKNIFDQHKDNPPSWEAFLDKYGQFQPRSDQCPTRLPTASELHKQAQKAETRTAAGSDGWRPIELKYLPLIVWEKRTTVLATCAQLGRYPAAYYMVNTTALQKKEDSYKPLDHRL